MLRMDEARYVSIVFQFYTKCFLVSEFLLKNEKVAESIAKMHPMKRLGEGSDSSSVAKFLLSEESSWITGQIFGVDGGRSTVA